MPIAERYRIEPSFEKVKEAVKWIFGSKSRIAVVIIGAIAGAYAIYEFHFKRAVEKQQKSNKKNRNSIDSEALNDLLDTPETGSRDITEIFPTDYKKKK